MSGIEVLDETAMHFGASDLSDPAEWWYCNAILDVPGTPIDRCTILGCFIRNEGAEEQGRYILVSPTDGAIAEFGSRFPAGTLTADPERFDVRMGDSYMRGEFPEWEMSVSGIDAARGRTVSADLQWTADIPCERMAHIHGRLKHQVCFRSQARGTVTLDGEQYDITGVGFYEHISGSFGWDRKPEPGEPTPVNHWNWYWAPSVGPDQVAVELWSFFCENPDDTPFPYVSINTDGTEFAHFNTGSREVLEEREIHGGPYPHKVRFTDKNEHGELDLTITRRPADSRSEPRTGKRTRMYLQTGAAQFEGRCLWNGVEYALGGDGFGSNYEHTKNPVTS